MSNEDGTSSSRSGSPSFIPRDPLVDEKLQLALDPPGACEIASMKAAESHVLNSTPACSPLNPKAKPFAPGTVDALMSVCGASGARSSPPPLVQPMQQSGKNSNPGIHQPGFAISTVPSTKVLQKAWSRKATEFTAQAEPLDSYKSNGIVELDEVEVGKSNLNLKMRLWGILLVEIYVLSGLPLSSKLDGVIMKASASMTWEMVASFYSLPL